MRLPRTPPQIGELINRLGSEFQNAFQNPELMAYARKCEAGYWPWHKVRMTAPSAGVDPEMAWLMIRMGRMPRCRALSLFGKDGVHLRFDVPGLVQRELMLVDQQTAGRLLVDDEAPLPHHQRKRFILSALREEAIASSMLEGAATTRRDAQELLRSGRKPRTRGERMVVNNYHAIQFVREHRKVSLSKEFLQELQSILTEGTLDKDDDVGRFRREEDNITIVDARDNVIIHVPPPASELDERTEQLCRFANHSPTGGEFIHPMIRACVLHFQLGFDHPFCDGNGRTARAIFYWSMLRQGYWLFEYLPISRLIYRSPAKYIRAFLYCETDEFDVTYFLTYKARIIEKARQELRTYLDEKHEKRTETRRKLGADRRLNHRQREVVLRAARNPDRVLTITEHKERFAISYGTARSDLLNLAEWDYLTFSADTKRYDFYAGAKLLGNDQC